MIKFAARQRKARWRVVLLATRERIAVEESILACDVSTLRCSAINVKSEKEKIIFALVVKFSLQGL